MAESTLIAGVMVPSPRMKEAPRKATNRQHRLIHTTLLDAPILSSFWLGGIRETSAKIPPSP